MTLTKQDRAVRAAFDAVQVAIQQQQDRERIAGLLQQLRVLTKTVPRPGEALSRRPA